MEGFADWRYNSAVGLMSPTMLIPLAQKPVVAATGFFVMLPFLPTVRRFPSEADRIPGSKCLIY